MFTANKLCSLGFLSPVCIRRTWLDSVHIVVFNLECRTTVDSNVKLNLIVPDSADWTSKQSKVRQVRWDSDTIYIIKMYAMNLAQV